MPSLFNLLFHFGTHNFAHRCYNIVFLCKVNKTNTLCSTSHNTTFSYRKTDNDSTLIDNHNIVFIGYILYCN